MPSPLHSWSITLALPAAALGGFSGTVSVQLRCGYITTHSDIANNVMAKVFYIVHEQHFSSQSCEFVDLEYVRMELCYLTFILNLLRLYEVTILFVKRNTYTYA